MRSRNSGNVFWGIVLLALAALVVLNQIGFFFVTFRLWDIVLAVIGLKVLIDAFVKGKVSNVPIAVGFIFIVLRNQALIPYVSTWTVITVAVLASVGLGFLFPRQRKWRVYRFGDEISSGSFSSESSGWGENQHSSSDEISTDNNPSININFGSVSRYLYADALESVRLSCNFGGMEIYFDQVQLHENGATVYLDCRFGGIDLFVPRHWNVVEQVDNTFGGTDVARRIDPLKEGAPTLTVVGDVSFGGVDIHYV